MEVYLLRHGVADNDSPTGKDADRRLTEEGRRKLREVLRLVADSGVRPEIIVSSPYVRARQTAEIAKEVLGSKSDLQLSQSLVPESDPEDVWHDIRTNHKGESSVLLASHEPLMGRCFGYFLGHSDLLVDFKKGAIVRIDFDHFGNVPRGLLKWMLIPKLAGA